MLGLDPRILVMPQVQKQDNGAKGAAWMTGASPGMTI
jgi:hypothetical protein